MAFTLNRRLAQLVDGNGQLNTGKIPNDYITSDHVADNSITSAMLHTSFTVSTSNLTAIDTDDVSEGSSNLYYTDARVDARLLGNTITSNFGIIADNDGNKVELTDNGSIEITRTAGSPFIDFKDSTSEDYDQRIQTVSGNFNFTADGLSISGSEFIDSSRNIDIGSGTISSGAITSTGEVEATALDINGNGDISGNLTLGGYIAGPATFTIDPAAVGDNTGTVVIAGNLQVDGTTTTINSTIMTVDDLNLTLASGAANSAAANGAGITVDGAGATITWDSTNGTWDFNKPVQVTGESIELTDGTRGAKIILDSSGTGNRAGLLLDVDSSDGIGIGSDYLFIEQDGVNDSYIRTPGTGSGNLHFTKSSSNMATINTTGLTVNGIGTFDNNGVISSASNRQFQIRDSDNTNMQLYMIVEKAADSGTGAAVIQVTESGVSNDRDLYIQGHGGATVIGSQSISGGSNKLVVSGGSHLTGNILVGDPSTHDAEARLQVAASDTSPDLSSATPASYSAYFTNSDGAYGTMFGSIGTGVGLIQQRRENDATKYGLSLQPYGGYVGIGTTNPTQMLHISHSTDGEGIQIDHTTVGGYSDILFTTKQNDGLQKVMHRLRSDMIDGTSGGEDSEFSLYGMHEGSEKLGLRIDRHTNTFINSFTTYGDFSTADTAGSNYHEIGTWAASQSSRITIRINGAIGFSNNLDHAGETVIHGTISNNSDFEGFFYGIGSNSTATAVAVKANGDGTHTIYIIPGQYGSFESHVTITKNTIWTPKTSSHSTGSSSLPSGAVGLQSEFGVNISGARKLLVNSSGNLELSNGLNSTAGTVQYSDGGSSFDSSNASGYAVFRQVSGSAQIGFERTGQSAGIGYIGADADNVFAIWDSSFNRKVIVTQSGNVDVNTGRIKVINSGTDAYFFEGVRDGGNTTLRMYDNNNNLYIDSYTNMTFRCNQTGGGSGGHIYLNGGNVGIGVSGAPQDKLHVESGSSDEITTFRVSSAGQITIARNHSTSPSITSYMSSGIPRFDFTRNGVVETRVASNQDTWFNASTQGNVGIGTPSPGASLHVNRNTNTVNNLDSLGFDVVGNIGNSANNPGNHYTSGLRIYQGSGTVGSGLGVMYLGADNGNATPENDYTGQISAPDGMSGGLRLNTFTNDAKIRFYTKHSSTLALRMDIDNEGIDIQGVELYSSTSASLTTTATDFYVNSTGTIGSGTYLLKIVLQGSGWYSEVHTGIMRWYSGTTNNPTGDTIHLTGMGHANTVGTLNARVLRKYSNTNTHSLQLWLTSGSSSSHTITIEAAKLQD